MAESFQRKIGGQIRTQGELIIPETSNVGEAVATLFQGYSNMKATQKAEKEEERKIKVRELGDQFLDEIQAQRDQLGPDFSITKAKADLAKKLRGVDPNIQPEVQSYVAQSFAQGGVDLTPTLQDLKDQQKQQDLQIGLQAAMSFGVDPNKSSEEEILKIAQDVKKLQLANQRAEQERLKAVEQQEADTKTKLKNITDYGLQEQQVAGSIYNNISTFVNTLQSGDDVQNTLSGMLTNVRAKRGEVVSNFAQLGQQVSGDKDALKEVEVQKTKALEAYDQLIKNIEELQQQPLEDQKRQAELMQNEFLANNPEIIKANQIRGFVSIVDQQLQSDINSWLSGLSNEMFNPQDKARVMATVSKENVGVEEIEAMYTSLSDEGKASASLAHHKMMLNSYASGNTGAEEQAKASYFYILNNVDPNSEQAPQLLDLAVDVKQKMYPRLNETERVTFDYAMVRATRAAIGDSQTGIFADVVRDPALQDLQSEGLERQDLLEYKNGKFTIGSKVLEVIDKYNQEPPTKFGLADRSRSQFLRKREAIRSLEKKLSKAVNQTNSYISESGSLDSPALKELTKDQRIAYLAGKSTGVQLSDLSNLPTFSGKDDVVEEAVLSGSTQEEVLEKRTEAQQSRDFLNASKLMQQVAITDNPTQLQELAETMEGFRGKIPDVVLDSYLNTINSVLGVETAESVRSANEQRQIQALDNPPEQRPESTDLGELEAGLQETTDNPETDRRMTAGRARQEVNEQRTPLDPTNLEDAKSIAMTEASEQLQQLVNQRSMTNQERRRVGKELADKLRNATSIEEVDAIMDELLGSNEDRLGKLELIDSLLGMDNDEDQLALLRELRNGNQATGQASPQEGVQQAFCELICCQEGQGYDSIK